VKCFCPPPCPAGIFFFAVRFLVVSPRITLLRLVSALFGMFVFLFFSKETLSRGPCQVEVVSRQHLSLSFRRRGRGDLFLSDPRHARPSIRYPPSPQMLYTPLGLVRAAPECPPSPLTLWSARCELCSWTPSNLLVKVAP